MRKLSAVIITHNEEKNIFRCLSSVVPVADEIIVVDSLSTDNTKTICQNFNVTFVEQAWLGYSEQKNFANNLAINDFILSLDADEALSEELTKNILTVKNNDFPSVAYNFNRLTFFCGKAVKHCGWNPDIRIRLWNKKYAQWRGDIHELLYFDKPVTVEKLSGNLLHYSFQNIEQHIQQINTFSTIAAQTKFKNGKKSSLLKIFLLPFWRFCRMFFFQLGFLDGLTGFIVCKNSAYAVFLRYIKLYFLQKGKTTL